MATKQPFVDASISETLKVYTNGSNEVFVVNKKSGVVVRISDDKDDIRITANGYRFSPTLVNNSSPGFKIYK
jgi:hypothetical protein